MSFFYEIRSTTDTILKRTGGFPNCEAATEAAREDAKKMKLSKHFVVATVGKILVGQSTEQACPVIVLSPDGADNPS